MRASPAVSGLGLLLFAAAYGQDSQVPDAGPGEASEAELSEAARAARAMEEVIVTGQRPIGALLREGEQLTEDFYMRLNEVLDNDDFRISCDNERRSGSNFIIRVCTTGFRQRLESRHGRATLQNLQAMQSVRDMNRTLGESGGVAVTMVPELDYAEMLSRQAEFEAAIVTAVNTDPVLNEQVIQLLALKSAIENYQSPRAQRREQRAGDRELQGGDGP